MVRLALAASRRLPLALLVLAAGLSACDSVSPVDADELVIEAYFDAGQALPEILVRRTLPVGRAGLSATGVTTAAVHLVLDGERIAYDHGYSGRYRAAAAGVVVPRVPFELDVSWNGRQARAYGRIPPPIRIDSVTLEIPDAPVEATEVDLFEPVLDSLGADARTAWIYPIVVRLQWSVEHDEIDADSSYYVETRLSPDGVEGSKGGFMLLPGQVLEERALGDGPRRTWEGVYAVRVDGAHAPLPDHALKVALLRSGPEYARYATTRGAAQHREPITNVEGGLGLVVGVALDSLRMNVAAP